MPFKSKNQLQKCYALKNEGKAGGWNCDEWAKETKNIKRLPESVKKAEFKIRGFFEKISKELFDPKRTPPVPSQFIQQKAIEQTKIDKRDGMGPVEYRNNLTHNRTGIVQKNIEAERAS